MCLGVEKGPCLRGDRRPKGTPLMMGFTMAPSLDGGLVRDACGGDDFEDPSCLVLNPGTVGLPRFGRRFVGFRATRYPPGDGRLAVLVGCAAERF